MKKSFVFLFLAGLLMASCAKEAATADLSGREVAVTMTAQLPGGSFTTRATNSAAGGVAPNVDFTVYTLRYIMEIYNSDGTTLIQRMDPTNTPSFTTRLVPGTYKVAFWADIVPQNASLADYHYNTASLQAVTLNASTFFEGSDDTRDAYTKSVTINVSSSGLTQSVTLTRPFGKVRIMAKDVMGYMPEFPATAQISYSNALPGGMNAVTGALLPSVIDPQTTPVYAGSSAVGDDLAGTLQTMAWDYIFAPATGQGVYTFTVDVYDAAGNTLSTRLLSSVPIQRNMLTTATGNFFTATASFNIIIDPAFAGEENIDISSVAFSNLQQYLDDYLALGMEGALEINVSDADATGTIDIPDYDTATVPFVGIYFTGDVTGNVSIVSTAGYDGDVKLGFNTISGAVSADLPDGNTYVSGPAAAFYDNFSASDNSSVFWTLGAAADIKKVLSDQMFPASLKGIIQTNDIFDANSDDLGNPASGAVSNQQSVAIGDAQGGDKTLLAGFVYDGQGYTLAGQGMNAIIQVYAQDVTVKDVTISNSWLISAHGAGYGSCMGIFETTGTVLDGVTVRNSNAGGVIVNGSEVTLVNNFTSSGNAWGGINLSKDSGASDPVLTIAPGAVVSISETAKIWADFAGADPIALAPNGWHCSQYICGIYPNYPFLGFEPGAGVIGDMDQSFYATSQQWTNDRYQPSAWNNVASFQGRTNVIRSTVDASTGLMARTGNYGPGSPWGNGNGYNTQGKGIATYNPSASTDWEVSVEVYVTPEMLQADYEPYFLGIWLPISPPAGYAIPIIGIANMMGSADVRNYTAGQMSAKWQFYNTDGTWRQDGPAVTAGWHTAKFTCSTGAPSVVNYFVDGTAYGSYDVVENGGVTAVLDRIVLQCYNFTDVAQSGGTNQSSWPGYSFSANFANVNAVVR